MSVLLEEFSPHGNLQAVVEDHQNVVYFYIWSEENSEFGVRSCWVRNLREAPEFLDFEAMEQGIAPLLPKEFCKDPDAAPPLIPEQLRVVWLEEGDGAALFEGNELLCVIPPWSGEEGFHGYSRDCTGESPLCWELEEDNQMRARVRESEEYWLEWENGNESWRELQSRILNTIETCFGKERRYFAIDGGYWPPKAVVETKIEGGMVLLTLGVCIRPQPQIEMYLEDPADGRRIEFGIAISDSYASDEFGARLSAYLSAVSNMPWAAFTWFGHGHTIACDLFSGFAALLFSEDPKGAPNLVMPAYRGDPVKLLWLIPITEYELELAKEEGSQAVFAALSKESDNYWMHARTSSAASGSS